MTVQQALSRPAQVRNVASQPMPFSAPWLDCCLRAMTEFGGVTEIPAHLAPTAEQRSIISRRIAELDAAMIPATRETALKAVTVLLAASSASPMSDDQASAVMIGFAVALDDIPGWAIDVASRSWLRGEGLSPGDNPAFRPTPAQIRRLSLAALLPHRTERHRLRSLLDARVVPQKTEAEREAMKARFAALLRPLAQADAAEAI